MISEKGGVHAANKAAMHDNLDTTRIYIKNAKVNGNQDSDTEPDLAEI